MMMRRGNTAKQSRHSEQGTALVAALWLSLVLALLAVVVISLTRKTALETRVNTRLDEAYVLAEGGLALAAHHIADARNPWRPRRQAFVSEIGGQEITIYVGSPQGKVDLNGASPALLTRLFVELGYEGELASALADRIGDYRDADDLVRLNGAERRAYLEAGINDQPKNAPFEQLSELNSVLGMDADLYTCVRPFLTLYAPSGQIDPALASGLVRRAAGYGDAPLAELPSVRRSSLAGQVYEVRVQVPISEHAAAQLTAIIRFTGNPADPVWRHSLTRKTVSLRDQDRNDEIPMICPAYAHNEEDKDRSGP